MGLREYKVDGKYVTFNKSAFKFLVTQRARRDGITKTKLEQLLAEQIGVAWNTVHKWNSTGGGPIDYETVCCLAEALGLSTPSLLLHCQEGDDTLHTSISDRELNAAKRIYDVCIWFLRRFWTSNGFFDDYTKFKNTESHDPLSDTKKLSSQLMEQVHLVLDQEYFDLHNCPIYDELSDFSIRKLNNVLNGELSYVTYYDNFPFEKPDAYKYYIDAMTCLNNIVIKYI